MKIIIILLIISAIIALTVSYWISSQEITSETNDQYNWSPQKITDEATENWKAKEKELEMMNEEWCKENPKLCKG